MMVDDVIGRSDPFAPLSLSPPRLGSVRHFLRLTVPACTVPTCCSPSVRRNASMTLKFMLLTIWKCWWPVMMGLVAVITCCSLLYKCRWPVMMRSVAVVTCYSLEIGCHRHLLLTSTEVCPIPVLWPVTCYRVLCYKYGCPFLRRTQDSPYPYFGGKGTLIAIIQEPFNSTGCNRESLAICVQLSSFLSVLLLCLLLCL